MQDKTSDPIDEIVLDEFPYPVAHAYRRLLDTDNLSEQANICLQVFHFSIRAIAFAVIIKYLMEPPEASNSIELNAGIREHLKKAPTMYWLKLLQLALQAYRDKYADFFMPELYELYWDRSGIEPVERKAPWELMDEMARLSNDIIDGNINGAARADELLEKLRAILRYFEFMRNYQLWYVRDIDTRYLTVEFFSGQERSFRHIRIEDIREPHIDHIKIEQFYIRNKHNHLTRLHPLIINGEAIKHLRESLVGDTGVYYALLDKDTVDVKDDELIYQMLASNQQKHISGDLVAIFLDLYERRLGEKLKASSTRQLLNSDNLRLACKRYTEEQIKTAQEKYINQAYIERDELNTVLVAFMQQNQPALVISGNVGVGKTNLLLHYYLTELVNRPHILPLWIDGALLDTRKSLVRTLLTAWDRFLVFDPLPTDEDQIYRLLRDMLDKFLPGETMVLLIDAVNENNLPMEAFGRINDFILEFPAIDKVKVILTTRPQVWQYTQSKFLKGRYKPYNYFSKIPDSLTGSMLNVENDGVVLTRYRRDELQVAFLKYAIYYRLVDSDLNRLTSSLRQAMQEPLLLRLTCETYQGKRIPDNMEADEIITRLIDSLVNDPSTNLDQADFDFLMRWIVPQFFPRGKTPVAKLTRTMLMNVQVSDNRTLDDLLSDTTEYLDRTPVNARAQRLMDTGWLIRIGSWDNYALRFRYEYFYDYFIGKYLFKVYEESADKVGFFEGLIEHLNKVPFLWGTLRNLLIDLLKEEEFAFIEKLGNTTEILQYELLVSVLSELYPQHSEALHPILLYWLVSEQTDSLAVQITANVAITCEIEDVLERILIHPKENVRFFVIQHIYQLWTRNHELTRKLFSSLSKQINLLKLKRNFDLLDTLLRCSLLLIMHEYSSNTKEISSLPMVLDICRPVIRNLFFVSKISFLENIMKHIRRGLLSFIVNRVVRTIRSMENSGGQVLFTFSDLAASFPMNEDRKRIVGKLVPHIDAAAGQAPESMESLARYLKELAVKGENDYITTLAVLAAINAHGMGNPLDTLLVLDKLVQDLETFYSPTNNPQEPTVGILYAMIYLPLANFPYNTADREVARQALDILLERRYATEVRFYNTFQFDSGAKFRGNSVVDCKWGYELDFPELGYQTLARFLALFIQRDDFEQIKRSAFAIAEGTEYMVSPATAFSAIYDLIQLLKGYLIQLDENRRTEFWTYFADVIILYTGKYTDELKVFVEKCEDDDLPESIKTRILNASLSENFNHVFTVAVAKFFGDSLKDKNPYVRNLIKWGFYQMMEATNVSDLALRCVVYIGNLIYGGELFAN